MGIVGSNLAMSYPFAAIVAEKGPVFHRQGKVFDQIDEGSADGKEVLEAVKENSIKTAMTSSQFGRKTTASRLLSSWTKQPILRSFLR